MITQLEIKLKGNPEIKLKDKPEIKLNDYLGRDYIKE